MPNAIGGHSRTQRNTTNQATTQRGAVHSEPTVCPYEALQYGEHEFLWRLNNQQNITP